MPSARRPSAGLAWAGGRVGDHGVPATRGVDRLLVGAAPLVAGAVLVVVVAVLRLQTCLAGGWTGRDPYYRMCYSDLANSVQLAGLGRGVTAYLGGEVTLDQPPLTGLVMALVGGFTQSPQVLTAQRAVVVVWAVLAAVLLAVMALRVRTTPVWDLPGRARADATHLVLSPVVALVVLVAPDILGVALATLGTWAWARRRPALAGVLLGTGVMARSYPVLVLLAIVAVTLTDRRDRARRRDLGRLAVGTLGAVVATAVLFVGSPSTLVHAWRVWWDAPTGLGSIWHVPALGGAAVPVSAATALAVAGWVVAVALVTYLVGSTHRTPPLGAVALVAVGVVLMTGKSFPVQASLWLVPLVALAGLRWRDHLVWAGAEAVHFVAVWVYMGGLGGGDARGLTPEWYSVAILVRLVGVGYLVLRAWETAQAPPPPARAPGPGVHEVTNRAIPAQPAGSAPRPPDD